MAWVKGQSGNPQGKAKGTLSKKTLDLQATCAKLGLTPMDVMLRRMGALWKRGTEESKDAAVQIAAMAAPYIHPRLAAQQLVVEHVPAVIDGKPLSSEAWEAEAAKQHPTAPAPKGGNGSVH